MSDWMDDCCESLIVPNITEVCLAGVYANKNKPNSMLFVFKHPEDVADDCDTHESILWNYTIGAKMKPTAVVDSEGNVKRMAVNLGGVQLKSLLSALGVEDEHLSNFMKMDRDTLVDESQLFVGCCVTCPMTGRVKCKDGETRIQFKTPELDFSSAQSFTDSVDEHREIFGPSDIDSEIHREAARKRITRTPNAVTPVGAEEGDEIVI